MGLLVFALRRCFRSLGRDGEIAMARAWEASTGWRAEFQGSSVGKSLNYHQALAEFFFLTNINNYALHLKLHEPGFR